MPLVYIDHGVDKFVEKKHPALVLDSEHPCYRMVREAIDDASVFHWTRDQAIAMYRWYIIDWSAHRDIFDEFGASIYEHEFKEIIKTSHYMTKDGKPSDENMEDMWSAYEMEKKILEDNQ